MAQGQKDTGIDRKSLLFLRLPEKHGPFFGSSPIPSGNVIWPQPSAPRASAVGRAAKRRAGGSRIGAVGPWGGAVTDGGVRGHCPSVLCWLLQQARDSVLHGHSQQPHDV